MGAARFIGFQAARWNPADTLPELVSEALTAYSRRRGKDPEAVYINPDQPGYNGEPLICSLPVILTPHVAVWSVVVGVKNG